MNRLVICPKCNAELTVNDVGMECCAVCNYWTMEGTARLDSITILE